MVVTKALGKNWVTVVVGTSCQQSEVVQWAYYALSIAMTRKYLKLITNKLFSFHYS